jgi:hypothetical protein
MLSKFIAFEPAESRKQLSGQLVWFLFWVGVTAVALYLTPSTRGHGTHTQLGLAPCASAALLHRPCPGCGLTTAFTSTVHGDLVSAFRSNAFGPLLYILFTISALTCGITYFKKVRFVTDTRGFNWALGILVGLFLLYGGIRFLLVSDYGP